MSVVSMSMFSARWGFALALALLCLEGRAAHAQAVPDWTTGWQTGFGNSLIADRGANPYGNLLGFSGGEIRGGNFSSRYNFSDGWFVGSERGGLGLNGLGQLGAFSGAPSFSYEGTQFGYNFKNAPVTVYAGFDTLKFNPGLAGPFANFDSTSSTVPGGYNAHVGVEFRPTSNLSLSVGAGFTQRNDSDINSALLPGASPFSFGRR